MVSALFSNVNMYLGMSMIPYHIKGITIGIAEREYGISVGDTLMVLGKAVYDVNKNKVIFKMPKFFMFDKTNFI